MPMWCVAPLEINEGNSLGARVQSPYRLRPFLVTRVSVFRIREILQCDLFCIACEDVLVHMRRTDQISCTIAQIKMRIRASFWVIIQTQKPHRNNTNR